MAGPAGATTIAQPMSFSPVYEGLLSESGGKTNRADLPVIFASYHL
jgi:hypothetical protein